VATPTHATSIELAGGNRMLGSEVGVNGDPGSEILLDPLK